MNGSRLSVPVEQFSLKLTFHLDHSAGAYQQNNVIFTSSAPHLGASYGKNDTKQWVGTLVFCRVAGGDYEPSHCRHGVWLHAGRMFYNDAEPGFHEVGSAG